MPDHPSWPAELVEKAADVIMEFVELRYDETVNCTVVARTLASALSGDLVRRKEYDATIRSATRAQGLYDRSRSQADALAEALEKVIRHGNDDDGCGGECTSFQAVVAEGARVLASYRSKPAPGETKG